MEPTIEVATWILLMAGSAFAVVGGIGLLRLPDLFSRMHGAGITDTLGAGLVLAGLIVHAGFSLVTFKLLFAFFFMLIAGATSTHALAKAALAHGVEPETREQGDGPSPT
jgi:multicomponent Na+:H+ antiporter subunit G